MSCFAGPVDNVEAPSPPVEVQPAKPAEIQEPVVQTVDAPKVKKKLLSEKVQFWKKCCPLQGLQGQNLRVHNVPRMTGLNYISFCSTSYPRAYFY